MGKTTGFLELPRKTEAYTEVDERIKHYREFTIPLQQQELVQQTARCMNCGIPFCHSGCPLGNRIPDFNDAVYQGHWQKASRILHQTNNFPEFTGRLCPAPCEEACVLNINADPVSIENIEKQIAEHAFTKGYVVAEEPVIRSGKSVAVVGSGPAGLAAAEQLNRAGHLVTVYEKDKQAGGLLRYGIPDFKLEKTVIERRLELLQAAGIRFKCDTEIGKDISNEELEQRFDAIALCAGANLPRDLDIPGRAAAGIHPAMSFLSHNNQVVSGEINPDDRLLAKDKHVIVIGGGDTGSDCIGTAIRQGARSVTNFEIMPKPPHDRRPDQPWPYWPMRLRVSSSHQEGVQQNWSLTTTAFNSNGEGQLSGLSTVQVEWQHCDGKMQLKQLPGSEKEWPCDMVLLAMGFVGTQHQLANQFDLNLNQRDLFAASEHDYQIKPGLFAAGDCRRGQSLVVWAISEGREMAHHMDVYLMGNTSLPLKGEGDLPNT
ncbi:glutamate synthase subunit beta [Marinicella sp. S1101]|uniref:glutamate synthase subunit beta n=1 Tax=Marinicella marina TaxID=2996016 RepID=UPI002260E5DD|nr:glutamate synthase subunit beta [Marinicella marina]MCX7554134.1 glutamate synthase subunit beta [Marinicella marina]MDJ1141173.1 glutamate synthase subunit beta [Marinicella marina]